MPQVWNEGVSQQAVKLYGPLERSEVVKSHAEFKITRCLSVLPHIPAKQAS